jgi:orotate phosphoribosyltransferase-like protein
MIMGQMKELVFTVEELLDEGLDEAEIAAKLDLPIDMIEELVAQIDETRYHEDMDTVSEAQEWHDYDPDC